MKFWLTFLWLLLAGSGLAHLPPAGSPSPCSRAGQPPHHLYDGWRVIQERNGNNTPQVSYTRGLDRSGSLEGGGIGGLLARSVHSTLNPRLLTRAAPSKCRAKIASSYQPANW